MDKEKIIAEIKNTNSNLSPNIEWTDDEIEEWLDSKWDDWFFDGLSDETLNSI